ncbi:hypothetical protein SAMN05421813_108145 [Daejeonella rubra]|uniref:CarboxypepD_reg-like domain-containing protein n=1 Tax=Daejeonella rubra TaxID=990371 RepID=A0A1G9RV72_9SPHI|nr:hypothetical protein [Daejeonella rubra]SDM26405.1 hypothetical protein SAMN05421813_108145 [Daejeonella rubra]
MRNWLFLIFLFCSLSGFSQVRDKKLVQFSGIIMNRDSNTVVPYVTITNVTGRDQFFSANYKGYFSFVANEGDTLVFTAVGYKREGIVIPVNLSDNKYTVLMKMQQEVINLPGVRVYPWASTDEFKKEFMTLKFADDDLEIAKKNVSRESLSAMMATLPRDGGEMQSFNFQNNHNRLVNRNINQRLANPLLNPFAWGALIQQIMQGDKSREQ